MIDRPMNGAVSYKWIVLLITTVGAFMTPLDGSIVAIALPSIAIDLSADYSTIIWVPTGYLLALTVLLIPFGRLSDLRGRKRMFILGFLIFTVASVLCSFSLSGLQLNLSRLVQGVGAALIAANGPAIVTDAFPPTERGKALGINTMAIYIGLTVGPTLGGFLVQSFGWRSIFYVNVPIGITVIALSLAWLREQMHGNKEHRFDILGAVTFSVGLASLLVTLTFGGGIGWTNPVILALFTLTAISFILFVIQEYKAVGYAMLELSLFLRNRLFAAANFTALLNYTSMFSVNFLMSFYLQKILGFSPAHAGLTILPLPLSMALLSPLFGWLSDRLGSRALSSLGMGLIATALLLLSTLSLSSSGLDVMIRLLILGVGMGLFSSPNTSAVMGSVGRDRLGVASGTLGTMRFMGQSMSLAIMGAVVATTVPAGLLSAIFSGVATSGQTVASEAFLEGLKRAFMVSSAISVVGVFTSLVRGSKK
jgi:EmrB/QacA subfamily drug resistance transporter